MKKSTLMASAMAQALASETIREPDWLDVSYQAYGGDSRSFSSIRHRDTKPKVSQDDRKAKRKAKKQARKRNRK